MPPPRSAPVEGVSLIANVSLSACLLAGADAVATGSGMRNFCLHFGQTTFLPAAFGGIRIFAPHFVQAIRAGSSLLAAPPTASLAGTEATGCGADLLPAPPSNGARPNSSPSGRPWLSSRGPRPGLVFP